MILGAARLQLAWKQVRPEAARLQLEQSKCEEEMQVEVMTHRAARLQLPWRQAQPEAALLQQEEAWGGWWWLRELILWATWLQAYVCG